jgi:hypothetical protein
MSPTGGLDGGAPPRQDPKPGVAVREVDYDDVDNVIGIASELAHLDADRLSVEDLVAIARDLDIPEKHVGPAIEELRRRRRAQLEQEQRKSRSRRWVLGVAAGLLVLFMLWALLGQAALSRALADVTQRQAQVRNVVDRQRVTQRLWEDRPQTDEVVAELTGAENRVRVERRRYDEVAAAYNARARAFPGRLWAALFGYPDHVALSHEITDW